MNEALIISVHHNNIQSGNSAQYSCMCGVLIGDIANYCLFCLETDDGSLILRFLDHAPTMYVFAHKAGILPSYSLTDAARSPE